MLVWYIPLIPFSLPLVRFWGRDKIITCSRSFGWYFPTSFFVGTGPFYVDYLPQLFQLIIHSIAIQPGYSWKLSYGNVWILCHFTEQSLLNISSFISTKNIIERIYSWTYSWIYSWINITYSLFHLTWKNQRKRKPHLLDIVKFFEIRTHISETVPCSKYFLKSGAYIVAVTYHPKHLLYISVTGMGEVSVINAVGWNP